MAKHLIKSTLKSANELTHEEILQLNYSLNHKYPYIQLSTMQQYNNNNSNQFIKGNTKEVISRRETVQLKKNTHQLNKAIPNSQFV